MAWNIEFHEAFYEEFWKLPEVVQDELLAQVKVLKQFGPNLGRPRVDTLNGSRYANMKELRFNADSGVWRIAFAFDSERKGVLLVAGDKAGTNEKRFYERIISVADDRFDQHLRNLGKGQTQG